MTAVGKLGDEIGLSAVEAAYGIHKVVTESMAAAARIHLVEKGKDPRAYAMVGFGGAGPAHAAGVARILGIREVIIPPASGAASCLGFLVAPLSFERVRSHPVRIAQGYDAAAINGILGELEAEGPRAAGRSRHRGRAGHGRAHAPTCASSGRCTRSTCRCRRARSTTARSARSAPPSRTSTPSATPRSMAKPRSRRSASMCACSGPRPSCRSNQAGVAAAPAEAQGCAPGLVRRRLRRSRRSTTATRSRPATASKARPSSRSARRPPSCRPATACAVDANLNLRLAIGVAAPPQALVAPGMPLADAMRAHRGRSDLARDHVEPPRHRGGRDVADRDPHGVLADHLGGAGLRLRAARRQRRAAGAFAARHAGVQSLPAARREGAAREVSARDAACPATCWSPTIRGSAPGICSTSRCSRRCSATASWSASSARSGTSATSAAPRTRSRRARSSRKASRSRR